MTAQATTPLALVPDDGRNVITIGTALERMRDLAILALSEDEHTYQRGGALVLVLPDELAVPDEAHEWAVAQVAAKRARKKAEEGQR